MPTPIILLIVLLAFLLFRGVQNGKVKVTGKKMIIGIILTVVSINLIMFFIL